MSRLSHNTDPDADLKRFLSNLERFDDLRQQPPPPGMKRMSVVLYTCRNRRCTAELAAKAIQIGMMIKCPHCYSETKVPNDTPIEVNVQCR